MAVESRVDHVGSLLRPQALLDARARREAGEIEPDEFKRIEDDAVRGESIQVGSLNVRVAGEANRVEAMLIGRYEENVGSVGHWSSLE